MSDEENGSDDGTGEMDPIKAIMTALGNSFIILKVYNETFIT